ERVFILAAYIINRYITFQTFLGIYTGDIVEDFLLEHLLPIYNLFLSPRLVVILDNASIEYTYNRDSI
ncbi:hypothetical protein DL98DRAFT_435989, partial [Cadophora sp. DSE1049]